MSKDSCNSIRLKSSIDLRLLVFKGVESEVGGGDKATISKVSSSMEHLPFSLFASSVHCFNVGNALKGLFYISNQFSLNQTLRTRFVCPNLHNPKPRRFQKRPPILLRALARGKAGHHYDIESGAEPMGSLIRDHVFVDQELAVAFLQARSDAFEDLLGFDVGPVVETGMHVVGSRT